MSATKGIPKRRRAGWVVLGLLLLSSTQFPLLAEEPFEKSVVRVYLARESSGILHGDRLIRRPRIREEAEFTGILAGPEGHVVTYVGNHWFKIGMPGTTLWVETPDGERKRARLAGIDERIALVVLESGITSSPLKPGEMTRDSRLRVVAPQRGHRTVSTPTLIGMRGRGTTPEHEVQFVAPERGERRHWEGGMVFDEAGSFLGIVTTVSSHLFSRKIDICQILPANIIEDSVKRILQQQGNLKAGWLGVHLSHLPPRRFVVERVVPGSPAEEAGLRPGDRLAGFDGLPVADLQTFERQIRWKGAGNLARLSVERRAGIEELKVHLTERRDSFPTFSWALDIPRVWEQGGWPGGELRLYQTVVPWPVEFGFLVDMLTPQRADCSDCPEGHGLLVKEIMPGSPAEKAGFKAGDVLIRINGRKAGVLQIQFLRDQQVQECTIAK